MVFYSFMVFYQALGGPTKTNNRSQKIIKKQTKRADCTLVGDFFSSVLNTVQIIFDLVNKAGNSCIIFYGIFFNIGYGVLRDVFL